MTTLFYRPGVSIGNILLLAPCGGTGEARRWRVRWTCCGQEETVPVSELRAVRKQRARSGGQDRKSVV